MSVRDERLKASDHYWHTKAQLFSGAYSTRELLLLPNKLFLRRRMEIVGRWIGHHPTAVALDAGCGSGELAAMLAPHYRRVIGVDYSQIMIDLALKSGAPTNVEFHQADCTKMPVADSTADRIFSLGLFDYLPDIDAALREFRRVVKPGGRIIVTIPKSPSLFAPMRWATGIRGKFFKVPPIVNALTRRQVDEAVTRHGLRIVDITSIWTTMWVIQVEANK